MKTIFSILFILVLVSFSCKKQEMETFSSNIPTPEMDGANSTGNSLVGDSNVLDEKLTKLFDRFKSPSVSKVDFSKITKSEINQLFALDKQAGNDEIQSLLNDLNAIKISKNWTDKEFEGMVTDFIYDYFGLSNTSIVYSSFEKNKGNNMGPLYLGSRSTGTPCYDAWEQTMVVATTFLAIELAIAVATASPVGAALATIQYLVTAELADQTYCSCTQEMYNQSAPGCES